MNRDFLQFPGISRLGNSREQKLNTRLPEMANSDKSEAVLVNNLNIRILVVSDTVWEFRASSNDEPDLL